MDKINPTTEAHHWMAPLTVTSLVEFSSMLAPEIQRMGPDTVLGLDKNMLRAWLNERRAEEAQIVEQRRREDPFPISITAFAFACLIQEIMPSWDQPEGKLSYEEPALDRASISFVCMEDWMENQYPMNTDIIFADGSSMSHS
jgi:hypothetical protein